jgi:hypothetical protein
LLIECSGIKELNISAVNKNMKINVSARVLEEQRRGRGGGEGYLVRKCGCHRKTQSPHRNFLGSQGEKIIIIIKKKHHRSIQCQYSYTK